MTNTCAEYLERYAIPAEAGIQGWRRVAAWVVQETPRNKER